MNHCKLTTLAYRISSPTSCDPTCSRRVWIRRGTRPGTHGRLRIRRSSLISPRARASKIRQNRRRTRSTWFRPCKVSSPPLRDCSPTLCADCCCFLAFFRSIALSPDSALQDTLRLLTLWFKYGHVAEVSTAIMDGFRSVSVDTWLDVIPQVSLPRRLTFYSGRADVFIYVCS